MNFKISPLFQEQICRIGSKLTFEEASEELNLMLRAGSNAKQVERVCHCYGEELEKIDWDLAYNDGVQLKIAYNVPGRVYCMADGSMVPTREEKWKEIKLGRIFTESSHIGGVSKGRGVITDSVYCAHFGHSNEFWERFCLQIPIHNDLVFICDGAKWLWNNIEALYPESTQILDYFHCKEHVCAFAREYYKKTPGKPAEFVDMIMGYLNSKQVDKALETIRELPHGKKGVEESKDKLLNYLTKNKKRIDYGRFKEAGLLVGSGPIESAHRDVIQKRMKLSGQRWTIRGGQQIANLRTTYKSKKWGRVLNLITNCQNAA